MENPRWFRRVLRAVGLMGDGETGVGGTGDLSARAVAAAAVVGRARASLGRAARASMFGEACEKSRATLRRDGVMRLADNVDIAPFSMAHGDPTQD